MHNHNKLSFLALFIVHLSVWDRISLYTLWWDKKGSRVIVRVSEKRMNGIDIENRTQSSISKNRNTMRKISATDCHRRMMQLIDLIWILYEIWSSSRKSVSSSRNAYSVSRMKRCDTLWSNRIWLPFTGDMTHEILTNRMILFQSDLDVLLFLIGQLINSDVVPSIAWTALGLSARHRKSAKRTMSWVLWAFTSYRE